MARPPVRVSSPWRALAGALGVLAGVWACSGIITGPDAPDLRPRSMRVTPSALTVARGDTARLTAFLYDATGAAATPEPGVLLTYASNDTTIARVDSSGLITGVAGGSTVVRGVYGALTLGIPVLVTTRPRLVVVSGDAQTAEQGDTLAQPIVVRALDAAGQPVANTTVDFFVLSGAGSVTAASVTTDGAGLAQTRWVLGVPLGQQTLRADRTGSDSLWLSAVASPATTVRRVTVTAGRTTLTGVGDTTRLVGRAYNRIDSLLPAASFTWSSGNTAVLTVSGTGLVTSQATGTAYVRGTSAGLVDSVQLTVAPVVANGVLHWSGAASDDWTLAANWVEGIVPTATDSVVVPATGVTNLPRFTATTFRSLVSLNASPIVLDGDGAVRVTDALVLRTDVLGASCGIGASFVLRDPTTAGPHAIAGRMSCGVIVEGGDRVLVDSLVLEGKSLGLSGTARLTLAGHPLHLDGQQLFVSGASRLEMLQATDRVHALFANLTAAGQGDMFAAGELRLRQGLAVVPGGGDFVTGAAHRVMLASTVPSDTATLLATTGVRFGRVDVQLPTRIDGTFALAGSVTVGTSGRLLGTIAPSFGLPERLRVGGDFTAVAGATTSVRVVELGGALVAPDFAPDTLVLIGTGQRLPLDGTVTGLRSVRIAAGATATIATTASTRRTLLGDLIVEGDLGMAESFTAAIGITGSLRVVGNGILRLGGTYSSLRVEGNALFDGRAMNGELATGDIELYGDLVQRASSSSRSLRTAPGFNVTFMRSGAIDFATPDSSYLGTIDHFGNLTRTLRSDLTLQGGARYDLNNVTVRSDLLGAGGTRTITSRGLVLGGATTLRNVAYRVLDGAALTLNGGATFADFDPSAIQLDLVRSSGTVQLDFASFTSAPSGTGRYLRVADPNGATGGTFTVNVSNVTPTTHGGFAEAVAPAVINGWPSGIVLPTISLGADILHPAGLQVERLARFDVALAAGVRVTVRSLDPAKLLLALDGETQGRDSVQVDALVGDTAIAFWLQGVEGATTGAALVVSAPGFVPDTQLVTMIRPAMSLRLVTPATVPTTGGADPVLQVVVGYNDAGTLVPMGLRAFGPGAAFTVASQDDAVARVAFNATANTIGADQPAATAVNFTLRPMRSATTLPDTAFSVPASLVVARPGMAGLVGFTLTGDPEWVLIGAAPLLEVVAVAPPAGCDTGLGASLVSGGPPTIEGAFCPTVLTPPAVPNAQGEVYAFWREVFNYGNGAYAEGLLVQFNATTGAVVAASYNLNDPLRSISWSCSNGVGPQPCTGLSVDLGARTATFANVALSNGTSVVFDGLLRFPAPAPAVIAVAPESLAFADTAFRQVALQRTVAITNGGGGTLEGLSADVVHGAGASDWLSVSFDATTAPATMTLTARPEFLDVGTFTATVTLTSSDPAVAPVVIPVTITLVGQNRIVIVSGDGQAVEWGEFAPDSLKVRLLRANGAPEGDAFVSFTVSAGGGSVSPSSEVTDNDGYVATRWLAGDSLGTFTVTASRSGFRSAVFTVTTVAGSYVTRLAITAPRTTLTSVGDSVRFTAAAFNRSDSLITSKPIVWATSDAAVATVSDSGIVAAVAAGTAYIRASVDGGIDSVLVTVALPLPVGLSIVSGNGQSASVATALGEALVVRYVDAGGVPVSGASIRYQGVYGCCNPFVDSTVVTDAGGFARLTPVMPTNALPVTVTVSVVGAPAVPTVAFSATPLPGAAVALQFSLNTGGGAAGVPVTPGWVVRAVDQYANVATAFTGAITVALSNGPTGIATLGGTATRNAIAGVATFDDLTVNVANSSWVLLASSAGLTGAASAAFSITIPATLSLVNTPLVGVNGTATMRVVLGVPAYGGGLTVALTSGNTGVLVVNAPASVVVPAGQTTADFTLSGISTGSAVVTATVDGATAAQTSVTVSTNTISVPLTLNLPYTRTASLPINLPAPAPTGGITITVTSGNPAIVGVLTPTVFIPQGGVSGSAQLEGLVLGQTAVTATGPNLATGTSAVTVTAALDLVETNVTINAGFSTANLTTRLLSGGSVFAAPAGGIPLTFVSRNTACVAAPVGVSVAAGLNSIVTTADYAGSAPTPCTTYLVVSSPSFDADSVVITVNPPPTTSLSLTSYVAAGLSRDGVIYLGAASPAGGTTVTITSSDPTRLVVAPNATTVGTASTQFTIPPGTTYAYFTYAAIEGQTGTAVLSATASRYQSPTPATITIDPLGVEASGTASFTMPGADGGGSVYVGSLTAAGPSQSVTGATIVRAGGQPVVVTLTSTTPATAVPVVGGVAASPATVTINPGQSSASYGVRPLAAGTTTITATAPNAASPVRPGYPATITVTQATTSMSVTTSVAAGLSRDGVLYLGAAAPPGGTVIRLSSSDPARLVLAPNSATVGTAFIDITVPAASTYQYFTYAAIEGAAGTTATISGVVQGAPAAFANPTPVLITIDSLGVEASGTTSFTMPGTDGGGTVYVGSLSPAGPSQSVVGATMIRAGGQPIVVMLTSTNPATAVPVVGGVATSPATVTINPGQSSATYGLRPLAAGTTTITATAPTAATPLRANYPATITVTQATTSFSVTTTVAAGLSRDGVLYLGAASPAGGTVVRLASSDSTRLVLAPNSTTVGTSTIDITIPAGSTYQYFTYAAIEGQAGTSATISAVVQGSPPAFSNPTPVLITIDPLGVELSGSTSITTLGNDGGGTVYLGSLGAAGPSQSVSGSTIIRAGGPSIVITLTSTTPTVAVPVVGGIAASPRTITLGPGQSSATYGIRPLVAGTTTITATSPSAATPVRPNYPAPITVNSPSSSISIGSAVGAGLAMQGVVYLQVPAPAGGTTVTLTSSDPSRLLVAANLTTAGAATVDIPVPAGTTYTYFTVMGLENVTGNPTVTAQTPGFTDATASVAVLPIGVQWAGTTSMTTLSPDGGGTVYLGIISGVVGNRTVTPAQEIRFGGVARTITMTSSDPAVVLPVAGGVAQQGLTVTVLPGSSSATVGVRPVGAGVATLAPSGAGLIAADAPGYPTTITVTVPNMTLSFSTRSQGAGLSQDGVIYLGASVPPGANRTLTLTSNDPSRMLLAPNATTTGTSQITYDLAPGASYTYFTVMGLEGATGTATVTASLSGYRDSTFTFTVVQPAVTLDGPAPTRSVAQGDLSFQAQVGVPSGASVQAQPVRYGAPGALTVSLASSAPSIGALAIGGVAAASQTISIPVGSSLTTNLASERVNFRPLAPGNVTITATIPGYLQQGNAIRTVTVSP